MTESRQTFSPNKGNGNRVGRAAPPVAAQLPVALTEHRGSVFAAGHQMLDFYAKVPFYANMFSNAGLPSTSDQQAVSDDLVGFGYLRK